ncbi:MAG: hypothetical protein HQL07_14180 [Nitrospirae bacterium]|nr:hypothetical protein [Magnetococcales bacterium]HAT50872.1 hypothetical protein [Alphaproteobacteria bacterium]
MLAIELSADVEEMFRTVSQKTGRPLDELVQEALDRFLEEWEDQRDAVEAQQLYREFKEDGEQGIPWKDVKSSMDLKHGL